MKPQKQTNQKFVIVSILQLLVHLIVYSNAFMKLIVIEAGGYANFGTIVFVGMSIVSLPLMLVTALLARFSSRLSGLGVKWGYVLHGAVLVWSGFMIYVCYFM